MLQVLNLRLPLEAGELGGEQLVKQALAARLKVDPSDIGAWHYLKRSIDARKKGSIAYVATIAVALGCDESAVLASLPRDKVRPYVPPRMPSFPSFKGDPIVQRPVIVGMGPAGLFAALVLVWAGARPIVIERGAPVEERLEDVQRFIETGVLEPESNIQFGEGGAGTFSDGKLTTGTHSPYAHFILKTLVDAGAPKEILWQAKPHIGSDILPGVMRDIRIKLLKRGAELHFHTRMDDLVIERGRVSKVICTDLSDPGHHTLGFDTQSVVLATGHSARDVFELLARHDVDLSPKPFSMGVRIEHAQRTIDRAQYGKAARIPGIEAATYKLFCHLNDSDDSRYSRDDRKRARTLRRASAVEGSIVGSYRAPRTEVGVNRGVYTFCMCPGGSVLASTSEVDAVVTNGGSRFARRAPNANSGLLVNVYPEDFEEDDPLAGMRFQRFWEQRAFELGGGGYRAPAQLLGDFMKGRASRGPGAVTPTYPLGVTWTDLEGCLPPYVTRALRMAIPRFGAKVHGFDMHDAVLTGIESRSSSPVRINRDETFQSSVIGLYPCGEGAGYAGGIMSAAADGINVAVAILGGAC